MLSNPTNANNYLNRIGKTHTHKWTKLIKPTKLINTKRFIAILMYHAGEHIVTTHYNLRELHIGSWVTFALQSKIV